MSNAVSIKVLVLSGLSKTIFNPGFDLVFNLKLKYNSILYSIK